MKFIDQTCREFTEVLSSRQPVPGGGGAAALVGALGTALAGMVANLTTGKKKYAAYENDIQRILKETKALQDELLEMVDRDAENFAPLAAAYRMPSKTAKEQILKEEELEKCTLQACQIPIEIVKTAYKAVKLQEELLNKGSIMALSDIGVGAELLRAALVSGWLNVKINTRSLKDSKEAQKIESEVKPLVDKGVSICEKLLQEVQNRLS